MTGGWDEFRPAGRRLTATQRPLRTWEECGCGELNGKRMGSVEAVAVLVRRGCQPGCWWWPFSGGGTAGTAARSGDEGQEVGQRREKAEQRG